MKVSIEIQDEIVRRWLGKLEREVGNLQPALEEISDGLEQSAKLRIRSSGPAPDGTPWAPLSPVTLALRRKHGKGAKPLQDKGASGLMGSITHRATATEAVVGTNLDYARMLQQGAKRGEFGLGRYLKRKGTFPIPWGDVPGRPYLGVSREDRGDILGIIRRRLLEVGK